MSDEATAARDAEGMLIGTALLVPSDLDELLAMVEPKDFYFPANAAVWEAIGRVHRAGNRPEATAVRLAMDESGTPHGFDPVWLITITQQVHVATNGAYYAEQVLIHAGLRELQSAGARVSQLGASVVDSMEAMAERREMARQAVDEACKGRHVSTARSLAQILGPVIDQAQNGQTHVLGTGWPDVDRLIGGLAPGRLVIVGARPGVGKSVTGTNLALHFAGHHQHAVLVASMEMPETEVGQRLLAAHASVNLTHLQMGLEDEPSWNRIALKQAELEAMPIVVDDAATQTVSSIRRAARDVQRSREDLALIVVDYLQLVKASDSRVSNRVEQLGEISRGLKLLARETGACVVAMAQLNREAAKHGDGKPRMSDLRESGSIEADADQVILLHQPDENLSELEVIVDKNRHGPKGQANLQMQGHYARLASVAWSPSKALA
jgi:replicative DNA helicase